MNARAWVVMLVCVSLGVGVAHLLDNAALEAFHEGIESEKDWYRLLRVMGYVPTWLVVGLVFVLCDRARRDELAPPLRDAWTRAVLLTLSTLSAGALAEALKLVIRRERPELGAGYTFRAFDDATWSSSGLGMPSSHTAVAFGALVMLGLLHPPARFVFSLVALGCAFTRVYAGAHFVSDVVLGAMVGGVCAWAWWTLHLRNLMRDGRKVDA